MNLNKLIFLKCRILIWNSNKKAFKHANNELMLSFSIRKEEDIFFKIKGAYCNYHFRNFFLFTKSLVIKSNIEKIKLCYNIFLLLFIVDKEF